MLQRKPIFPNVIELNVQAGHLIGCNVYLIHDSDEWVLLDIGYEDSVEEVIDLIRELDFPLSKCKSLIATHADVDHSQGFAKAKQLLKTTVTAHPNAAALLEAGVAADVSVLRVVPGGIRARWVEGPDTRLAKAVG